ncbi:nicotinamide/nicotinic acid mononucleotide adenylyltransferase 3 [Orussus abietinus]|uniref:nicotinamide/nicotinic acid mononucleotide adenylyltransferase 3 n=1 Tax=Orussus abietinus TaxID=222816 RepID=UPI0006259565|nr:nicotinamide/nicotinic acid mononucleotide adenylyltransferase 3 [Orussus abietinus]
MSPPQIILMSCGCYNPPTNMHLRMFEVAKDHLHRMGTHAVVGGIISPAHDGYGKRDLASASHRCAMLKLALKNNDWVRVSTWETRQNCWMRTKLSLQYHQSVLNSVVSDTNGIKHYAEQEDLEWIPENVKNNANNAPIQIKLLCGADLLESFEVPGLWIDEEIDAIVSQHGLIVVTREGSNPHRFIYESDILSKHVRNITIVTEWIPNEISSSKIRKALRRGESVKYLVQDPVIDYIYTQGIYDVKTESTMERQNLHAYCKTDS